MDKSRLLELAGVKVNEAEVVGDKIQHSFNVGDQNLAERISLMIRNPAKGWHANARDGVVTVVVNVDSDNHDFPGEHVPAFLRKQAD